MFKYEILKKGRKWYHAQTADDRKYKAHIEINDVSKDWEVGSVVEFLGRFEKKVSYGYTKVYIYPLTEEEKEGEIAAEKERRVQQEINKWLGYVEQNADEYVYKNGVAKLRDLPLNEEQQERLESAIKQGTASEAVGKMKKYFSYINDSIDDGKWYFEGERVVKEQVEILKELGKDVSNYEEKLQQLKNDYTSKKEEESKRYFQLTDVSFQKRDQFRIGAIMQSRDGRLGKVVKSWRYYEPDTMSLGFHEVDGGWLKCAKLDVYAVTEKEKEAYFQRQEESRKEEQLREEQAKKRHQLRKTVSKLIGYIRNNGEWPQDNNQIAVSGDIVYDTFDLYGGGDKVVISGSEVWGIKNNGADGDDWRMNNVSTGGAGAIGYKMTIDRECEKLINSIRELSTE